MKLLLDTHTLLWYVLNDSKLSAAAKALILDPNNEVFISPASYWEIAIKVSCKKIALYQPYEDFMDVCINKYRFAILPIEPRHTAVLTTMPYHHRDPFDRLLIAQTLVEKVPIVSVDAQFDAYAVSRLW